MAENREKWKSKNYRQLVDDLPHQFRNRPRIDGLIRALARQLDELDVVSEQLKFQRWLKNAVGQQLDNIGDIVILSREEAEKIAMLGFYPIDMVDNLYRKYLAQKIMVNTSNCTYQEIYDSLKLVFDDALFYYSEDPDRPAEIDITFPILSDDDWSKSLVGTWQVRPAGVWINFIADQELNVTDYYAGVLSEYTKEWLGEDTLPIGESATDYYAGALSEFIHEVLSEDAAPIGEAQTDYYFGVQRDYISESFREGDMPIADTVNDYYAAVAVELFKERFTAADEPLNAVYSAHFGVIAEYVKEEFSDGFGG